MTETSSNPKCPYCDGKGVDAHDYLCLQCSGTGQTGPFVITPQYVANYQRAVNRAKLLRGE